MEKMRFEVSAECCESFARTDVRRQTIPNSRYCDAQRAAIGPQCRVRTKSVTDPCGTPHRTAEASEADMQRRMVWMRPLRYDANQPNTVPPIPYDLVVLVVHSVT